MIHAGSLVALVVALAPTQVAPAEPEAAPRIVLSLLAPTGGAALAAELERARPGKYRVESADSGFDPGAAVALIGCSAPEVLARFDPAALHAFPAADRLPLDAEDGTFVALFVDPVIVAFDESEYATEIADASEAALPRSIEDLADGRFEGRFFAADAAVSNATGVVLGALALAGGDDQVDSRIEGFGANLTGRIAATAAGALAQVEESQPLDFAVIERSVLRRAKRTGRLREIVEARPWSGATAIVRGIIAPAAEGAAAEDVLGVLLKGDALRKIAAAEGVAPLRSDPRSAVELDAEDEAIVRSATLEAPALRLVQNSVVPAVARFHGGLKDRLKRRQERFESIYDVVAMLAIAGFVAYVLFRRSRRGEGAPTP